MPELCFLDRHTEYNTIRVPLGFSEIGALNLTPGYSGMS
jgi:hypothetical protein